MRKKRIDMDMPAGKLTRAKDVLPPPEELMMPERTIKVTLRLSESSVKYFKHYAQKYHMKYQKIIRKLLDAYAEKFAV